MSCAVNELVVYASKFGNTFRIAEPATEGARSLELLGKTLFATGTIDPPREMLLGIHMSERGAED